MEQLIQQILNGLMIGSTYAVVALGFGLIFLVFRVVNLAHPEFFMLGAYIASLMAAVLPLKVGMLVGVGAFIAVLLVAIVGVGACGLLLERLVIRPLRGTYILIPLIATAGVATALQYSAQRFFGADPVLVPAILPLNVFNIGGVTITSVQISTLIVAVTVMVFLMYYVYKTRWGRATRAVAERPEVGESCGVNVNRVSQMTVAISAAMGGVAGVAVGLLYGTAAPFMGAMFGVKAFVCMLVAGNKRIEGILIVGVALGILESLVTGYLTSNLRDAVAFGSLLAILVFRPAGIFGSYKD